MWLTIISLVGPLLVKGFGAVIKNKQLTEEQKRLFREAAQTMNHSGESARLRKAFKKLEADIEFDPSLQIRPNA